MGEEEKTFQAKDLVEKIEKGKLDPAQISGRYILVSDQSMRHWSHDNIIKALNRLADAGWRPVQMSSDPSGAGNIIYVLLERS